MANLAVKIRSYQANDLESVATVFTESVHGLASARYDALQCSAWAQRPPDLSSWQERLSKLHTLVAEADGDISGFLSYDMTGHIDLLFVSPAYARRGVASLLYRNAELALNASGVTEQFTEASLVARPFFESKGFSVVEEQVVTRNGVELKRFAMRK